MKGFLLPSVIGGAVIFILGKIPGVNSVPCLGCLWPVLGGMLAVKLFLRKHQDVNFTKADGRLLGLSTGLSAGFIFFAWVCLLFILLGPGEAIESIKSSFSSGDFDEILGASSYSYRQNMEGDSSFLTGIVLGYYFGATIMGAIGGSIMVRISGERKMAPEIPETAPPPAPLTIQPLTALSPFERLEPVVVLKDDESPLGSVEGKMETMGFLLPSPPQPLGAYVPCVRSGNLVITSGFLPLRDGGLAYVGKLGRDLTVEEGQQAARLSVLNGLAALKEEIGSLDKIIRIVKVVGHVSSVDGFTDQAKVVNGASEFLLEVFGDKGKHARMAIGAAELPANAPVAIELIVEVG